MKNAMRCVSFLLHFGILIRIRKSRDYVQKEDFLCKISLIKIIFEFNSSGNVSKSVCESHKRKLITRKKMSTMVPGNLYIKALIPNYPDSLTSLQ